MTAKPPAMSADDATALVRWRLALGPEAETVAPELALRQLRDHGAEVDGVAGDRLEDFDDALGFAYDERRRGGTASARAYLPKWLGLVRELFSQDVVALVQRDAIERKQLTELLFEPETLPLLDKNVDLVATLLAARGLVPDRAKDAARQIVKEVVDQLREQLESETRTALLGAVRRSHSPLKLARNIDWRKTIDRNLRGWDAERRRLIADRVYFWSNQRRRHDWDIAIAVDQSGSMAQSVVYSAVMAAIFASLDVLRTRVVLFDTEIADVTPLLVDPVDVLFASQLGGGTDIHRAVAYVQHHFIEQPEKTIFLLITDLFEGGDADGLVARVRALADSKVKVLVILALSDGGAPSFDHELAARLAAAGAICFGCTPKLLVWFIERIMKNQDPASAIAEAGAPGPPPGARDG